MPERLEFLDIAFDQLAGSDAVQAVLSLANSAKFAYVVTPNVDHIVKLHRQPSDPELWQTYQEADLCLCDSRILQMLAGWSGLSLPLMPGSDLTAMLLDLPLSSVDSISVIGGTAKMVRDLEQRFPSRTWHHHIPPMGVKTNFAAQEQIIRFVEEVSSDLTFMAIGAPQSELLCNRLAARGRAGGVALCVGASLEFLTGEKRRAPRLFQNFKLEWLFRLLSEPRRLARRYLLDGPQIFRIWSLWEKKRLHQAS